MHTHASGDVLAGEESSLGVLSAPALTPLGLEIIGTPVWLSAEFQHIEIIST